MEPTGYSKLVPPRPPKPGREQCNSGLTNWEEYKLRMRVWDADQKVKKINSRPGMVFLLGMLVGMGILVSVFLVAVSVSG